MGEKVISLQETKKTFNDHKDGVDGHEGIGGTERKEQEEEKTMLEKVRKNVKDPGGKMEETHKEKSDRGHSGGGSKTINAERKTEREEKRGKDMEEKSVTIGKDGEDDDIKKDT